MNKFLNLLYVVFILCFFLWMQNATAFDNYLGSNKIQLATTPKIDGKDVTLITGMRSELPKGLIVTFGEEGKAIGNIEQRIASSLQKVGKNLVLEQTRGTKEVALYQNIAPAVVFVLTENTFGSGAIVDQEGHVITNWHVVQDEL
jgi:S1-C subfamily serine protease